MSSIATLIYSAAFLIGGIAVRRAKTWKGERTGWFVIFLSTGLLMSLVT